MTTERILYLFDCCMKETCSAEEQEELLYLLQLKDHDPVVNELVTHALRTQTNYSVTPETAQAILQSIFQADEKGKQRNTKNVHRIHFLKTTWFKYAAAILIVFGIGAYLYESQKSKPVPTEMAIVNDVPAPANSRATLTLANGQKIFLDSAGNGILAREGETNIEKTAEGNIVYQGKTITGEMQYNTLSVPKGSQIANIILSDGSRVYLNAASSIKYPVVFDNKERKVEINGEAYLEVTKDKNRKFVVVSKGMVTEVLGTSFNVNAFADEETESITLVEGSVKVSNDIESVVIKPGEQVSGVLNNKKLSINHHANLRQVTGWKKGMFIFTNMPLASILRQVERWYNVTVKYEGVIPPVSYGGGISRSLPLSEVIKLLQSEKIAIDLNGNLLTVKSKNMD